MPTLKPENQQKCSYHISLLRSPQDSDPTKRSICNEQLWIIDILRLRKPIKLFLDTKCRSSLLFGTAYIWNNNFLSEPDLPSTKRCFSDCVSALCTIAASAVALNSKITLATALEAGRRVGRSICFFIASLKVAAYYPV